MKSAIFYIAGFFISVIIAFFIDGSLKSKAEIDKNRIKEIENTFHKREKVAICTIDSIISNYENGKQGIGNSTGNKLKEEGIEILCYQNDSLIFWNSNKASAKISTLHAAKEKKVRELGNGYYYTITRKKDSMEVFALILIKHKYLYQNKYLKNSFHKSIGLSGNIALSFNPETEFNVENRRGEYIFSLINSNKHENVSNACYLTYLFYFLSFLFLVLFANSLYSNFKSKVKNTGSKTFMLIALLMDVLIVRLVFCLADYPEMLHQSIIFSPQLISHSIVFPNLGDALLNICVLLFLSVLFYKTDLSDVIRIRRPSYKLIFATASVMAGFAVIIAGTNEIQKVIFDSSINYDLKNLFELDIAGMMGLFMIVALFIIQLIILSKIVKVLAGIFSFKNFIIILISLSAIAIALNMIFEILNYNYVLFGIQVLLIVALAFLYMIKSGKTSLSVFSVLIFILSAVTTYSFYLCNQVKNREYQRVFIENITAKGNPLTEYLFCAEVREIESNKKLITRILDSGTYEKDYNQISKEIEDYFNDKHWYNFEVFVTICDQDYLLNVIPEDYLINCDEYFSSIIKEFGDSTSCCKLYSLENHTLDKNFLGVINIDSDKNTYENVSIYIELFSKFVPEGLGYPELLISGESGLNDFLKKYSYAKYSDDQLVYKFGNYMYSYYLNNYAVNDTVPDKFHRSNYNHYTYKLDDETKIIISEPFLGFFDVISPFSYILIIYLVYALLFLLLSKSFSDRYLELNLRNRLQYSIIGILIVSFIILGSLAVYYFINLNNENIENILREKSHSVLIELEHKLSDYDEISPELDNYVFEILNKFSQVFFSDINLYNISGTLIASSRSKLFEEGMISSRMNRDAYEVLTKDKKILYIQKEKIGSYEYLSAYSPLMNVDNKTIAYLNLPYFAKQEQLKNEISTFITAFLNVFIIIFVFAFLIAIVITRYITKPLQLIREKISSLKLDKLNEKLEWKRDDEIGSLVKEYNRMLDELEKSAEMLAKTERESAWREMARQVAHEIKNPLTPMKLSVQHLYKTKNPGSEKWNNQFNRVTKMLIEQIDTLSAIANDFSNFAKMPVSKNDHIDLKEVILNAAQLYRDIKNVKFDLNFQLEKKYFIFADKKLIIRVFNNVFENAIQASEHLNEIVIKVELSDSDNHHIVSIQDFGCGISEELSDRIFLPSFTTKTSGMGLGLAIVKSIVSDAGGEISFKSKPETGTTFYIKFPMAD